LEKEVLCNHQQSVTANIYKFPLIRWEKVGPKMNLVRSHLNNLQKIEAILLLKIILFRQFHIAQHTVDTPKWIIHQIMRAKGQEINR
jgi:hypothetical protein